MKNLHETKLAYDKLKVDSDVDKRDWEMRIANEIEQTKKFQGLVELLICGRKLEFNMFVEFTVL